MITTLKTYTLTVLVAIFIAGCGSHEFADAKGHLLTQNAVSDDTANFAIDAQDGDEGDTAVATPTEDGAPEAMEKIEKPTSQEPLKAEGADAVCPVPDYTPDIITRDTVSEGEEPVLVDHNQEIKALNTDLVVKHFFANSDNLFNFMKLVYGNLDAALDTYKKEHNYEDRAAFLLFKGGNVLRMVANEALRKLTPEARELLEGEYAQYFKRSDADFSIYIDETKLNNADYEKTIDEISRLTLNELDKIRDEFNKDPQKYFSFFQWRTDFAGKKLQAAMDQAANMESVKDENNPKWHGAKFLQFQLQDVRANQKHNCGYLGQYDYRFENENGNVRATKLTDSPHWIANSDNRTIQFPWGSAPSKLVKFYLVRSKAFFDVTFVKDGEVKRKPIGGELIDVSLPHRADDRLRPLLDNYDKTVAAYTLSGEDGETLTFKSYSLLTLAEDLQFIIFDSFKRPWLGGSKYGKRVNRIFFLYALEMLDKYGQGSKKMANYISEVQDKVITPLEGLLPLNEKSAAMVSDLRKTVHQIDEKWPNTPLINDFLYRITRFAEEQLVKNPQEGDQEGFSEMLDLVKNNLDIATKLTKTRSYRVDAEEVYNVGIKELH